MWLDTSFWKESPRKRKPSWVIRDELGRIITVAVIPPPSEKEKK
jgi:hypothetical protein